MKQGYLPEIEARAKEIGYKAANCEYLPKIFATLNNKKSPYKVLVPKFESLTHTDCQEHLSAYAPSCELFWLTFVRAYMVQANKTIISPETNQILISLQKEIIKCFKENNILLNINFNGFLAVRSSSDEDSVDIANQGGNETILGVTATKATISEAIGRVIASYFSEKSLIQRLKAKADITKEPFMPVFIQEMVSEKAIPSQPKQKSSTNWYAGVAFSYKDGSMKVNILAGHNEAVVNNLLPTDIYYITSDGFLTCDIANKEKRLVPVEGPNGLTQQTLANSEDVALKPSLNNQEAEYLHLVAKTITAAYGYDMDIEFAYDKATKTFYIFQARAIVKNKEKQIPSAMPPEILAEQTQIYDAQAINIDSARAVVITKSNEVIIANTIAEAHKLYRASAVPIKAVIITEEAASTSHEVGELSSHGILVMRTANIEEVKKFIPPIILDVQWKKICKLQTGLKTEEELYKNRILKEGLFRSPISRETTAIYNIASGEEYKNTEIKDHAKFVELLKKADLGEKAASEQLMSFLFDLIPKEGKVINIKQRLERLNFVKPRDDNASKKEHLGRVLKFVYHLRKKNKIDATTFQHVMVLAGNLYLRLEELKTSDDTKLYLDSVAQFTGAVITETQGDRITDSVFNALKPEDPLLALGSHCMTKELKDAWTEIVNVASKTNKEKFQTFLAEIVKDGIADQFMNTLLGEAVIKTKDVKKRIIFLLSEYNIFHEQVPNLKYIKEWIQKQVPKIPNWQKPEYYEKNYNTFSSELKDVASKLSELPKPNRLGVVQILKQVEALTELLDLTIKSLTSSKDYEVREKAKRFRELLLNDLFPLMQVWTSHAGFMRGNKENRDAYYELISSGLKKKERIMIGDFQLTDDFNVSAVTMDTSGLFRDSSSKSDYKTGLELGIPEGMSLENYFTLIHQNILRAVAAIFPKEYLKVNLPANLKYILNAIEGDILSIEVKHPNILVRKNLALRDHSCKIDIKFNYTNNICEIEASFTGTNYASRWSRCAYVSNVYCLLNKERDIVTWPSYDEKRNNFSFKVKVKKQESIDMVADWIKVCKHVSYDTGMDKDLVKYITYYHKILGADSLEEFKKLVRVDKLEQFLKIGDRLIEKGMYKWTRRFILPLKLKFAILKPDFEYEANKLEIRELGEIRDKHPLVEMLYDSLELKKATISKPSITSVIADGKEK